MSPEIQKPENILAALESKKGSLDQILKSSWEGTKRDTTTTAGHFTAFHLNLMQVIHSDVAMAFNITLGLLADHLLPHLTEEEKEALRNESTELEGK